MIFKLSTRLCCLIMIFYVIHKRSSKRFFKCKREKIPHFSKQQKNLAYSIKKFRYFILYISSFSKYMLVAYFYQKNDYRSYIRLLNSKHSQLFVRKGNKQIKRIGSIILSSSAFINAEQFTILFKSQSFYTNMICCIKKPPL